MGLPHNKVAQWTGALYLRPTKRYKRAVQGDGVQGPDGGEMDAIDDTMEALRCRRHTDTPPPQLVSSLASPRLQPTTTRSWATSSMRLANVNVRGCAARGFPRLQLVTSVSRLVRGSAAALAAAADAFAEVDKDADEQKGSGDNGEPSGHAIGCRLVLVDGLGLLGLGDDLAEEGEVNGHGDDGGEEGKAAGTGREEEADAVRGEGDDEREAGEA